MLREDARFRILRLLSDNPEMSQREIASSVGISHGATNYLLKALVEKGHVKLANFQAAADKRRYAYVLTPRGLAAKAELTRKFLVRKRAEFDALQSEIEALEADMGDAKGDKV
ncbi:MAG: MarR family EPS-associated transcriptional regulator [Maritimibacter sp.]|nr:MarR family EPS-associated transcriptional regulator [Maritimibacter sp.]